MLNYDDFIWKKYQIGAWLKVTDPSTGQAAVKNLFYSSKARTALHYSSESPDSPESLYQNTSIQALQHRGVKLLACHTAAEEQARALIAHNGLTQGPEEIVESLERLHLGVQGSDPIPQFKATAKLGEFLETRFYQSF